MSMMSNGPSEREQKKRVFISYSWADAHQVDQLKEAVRSAGLDVWIDRDNILLGDRPADKIKDGIAGSDYFLLYITDKSSKSEWVKREISYAFELSREKKTTIVPALTDNAELPIEFSGYLYIDFRESFAKGLAQLRRFFKSQSETSEALSFGFRQSSPIKHHGGPNPCVDTLGRAKLGSLRYAMSDRLTIDQIGVIWFDIFERRMDDDVNRPNVAMACVELIDRARRESSLPQLLKTICRNVPSIANHPNLMD
ncbi:MULTISPECIES: toll/interleukin-1 receptor domain-containing protein [Methylobacteriaceae]|uniref:toll/interleukin-1 receptor domain-containing protein n=1 Tax=Methylobacteriaceae TaxID=119045 RepID=UPI0021F28DC4|nr:MULTISPECIES: toll/interleukin-1 receptor domain-containing protein [Methylobacteriaceae]MCY1644066.1 toll/interleukin-1 receptor domain-containing protein [Methylorubrum sp. SL192]